MYQVILPSLLLLTSLAGTLAGQPANLVTDGDFEREGLKIGTRDVFDTWVLRNHGAEQVSLRFGLRRRVLLS